MIPSKTLIEALRRAATRIEDPNSGYGWHDGDNCNCGILAQEILNVDETELRRLRHSGGSWNSGCWHRVCQQTGATLPSIFAKLEAAGFAREDFVEIELLANEQAAARGGIEMYHDCLLQRQCALPTEYLKPATVARYFRAQADILAEQLAQQEQNNLQCGVERSPGTGEPYSETRGGQIEDVRQCPKSTLRTEVDKQPEFRPATALTSPVTAALAKECVHMWCGKQCLYCCAVQPVEEKEITI